MKSAVEFKEERMSLVDEAEAIFDKAEAEKRDLTPQERARVQAITDEDDGLLATAYRGEQIAAAREPRSKTRGVIPDFHGNGKWGETKSSVNLKLPKLTAFNTTGDREQDYRNAHQAATWFRATLLQDPEARADLRKYGDAWNATHVEGSGTLGGYLLPGPAYDAIIAAREQVGATRQLARVVRMTTESLTFPKRTGGLTVYAPGEGNEITESNATFGELNLIAKKRAVLAYVSSELRDDAAVEVVDFLMQEMGHALALREDQELINGDGTSSYSNVIGLLNTIGTAGINTADTGEDTWAELDLQDFYETMSLIADSYRVRDRMSWLCSAAFKWQVMDRLAAEVNGAGASQVVDGQMKDYFLGYPIVLSDRMPTAGAASTLSCLFGNFPHSVILGDRHTLRLDTDTSVAFTSDRIAIRATSRYDMVLHDMGDDDSTPGAVVGLKTAA